MRYRRLIDNDYSFGRGRQDFLTDIEAVAQAIKTRLLLLYAEWWEDLEDGLPLWQKIIGVPGNAENIAAIDIVIRSRIEGTAHVQQVLSYYSAYENRTYTFHCLVQTDYGNLTVSM